MPKFWGVLEPGLQRPGGKFWWAELDYAFKVWLDLTVGMLEAGKSSAGFGVQIPLSVAMDGRGVSGPAAFNVQLALVIGMTRPAPIPAGFGVSLPVSVSMVGTEQYARNLAVNVPVSIGMAGASKSVGAFGVSLPLSVGMAGSFVPGDIQFIGGDSAESSTSAALTAAITGQKAGDLVLLFGFRDGSTTAPTIPAGFTQYGATASGNSCCSWIAYRYATADAEAGPGTVTNATGLVRHVYRAAFVQMLGSIVNQNASSATITYPAMSMTNVDTGAKSWAVAFAGHRSTNGSLASPPAGMTNRTSLEGATNDLAGHDTGAGGVASWSAQTVASGETSSGYCVQEVEIWPAGVMSFENVNLTGITTPAGKSARLRMRGAGASGGSANKPSSGGWGGGGGGGGAYVDVTVPAANLGATFGLTRGLGGAAPAGNAANNGNAGGDSTFTSGASTVTAGGGQGGQAGGSGTSAGGTGGTVAVPAGITPAISENGAPGGNGSRVAGAGSQGGDSTHAGPGGGGGGSNTSSQYAGGPGGISGDETARAAGGSAGGGTGGAGTNAPTVDGAGSAGGGGGGNSGFGGTGGTGGLGGTSGAGGGGAGGKEGSTGSGGAGQAGAPGYTRLDFV